MSTVVTRRRICETAVDWIGTPYLHQASTKGAGSDCLGLVRGVWRELYGAEPAMIPPYSPDWAERGEGEILKTAADSYLTPVDLAHIKPADILLFRMRVGVPAKHMAIVLEDDLILHAYWGRAVTKSFLSPFWRARRAYAYCFPNVRD
ncbi:MAG: peptidase P60 [Robiginitomaculum sp.]|nr:MAG: peptidase P60 [Robiginitomaculum sp.]